MLQPVRQSLSPFYPKIPARTNGTEAEKHNVPNPAQLDLERCVFLAEDPHILSSQNEKY
jgi:hypothetical protein